MIWKKIPLLKGKKEGQEKKKLVRRGVLRRRWLVNTLVTTLAIVAIAVSAFSLAIYNYYLATILATLESKAQTAAGMFQNYTETTYLYAARQFINQFEEKTTIEVQFLTPDGEVLMTSLMDLIRLPGWLTPCPAIQGVHTGGEFGGREGLGHIVVRPRHQPCHLVHLLGAGGEHNNADLGVARPDAAAHLKAVHLPGQHDVQQGHPNVRIAGDLLQGLLTGARLDGLISRPLEVDDHKAADIGFILQNQYFSHARTLLYVSLSQAAVIRKNRGAKSFCSNLQSHTSSCSEAAYMVVLSLYKVTRPGSLALACRLLPVRR